MVVVVDCCLLNFFNMNRTLCMITRAMCFVLICCFERNKTFLHSHRISMKFFFFAFYSLFSADDVNVLQQFSLQRERENEIEQPIFQLDGDWHHSARMQQFPFQEARKRFQNLRSNVLDFNGRERTTCDVRVLLHRERCIQPRNAKQF